MKPIKLIELCEEIAALHHKRKDLQRLYDEIKGELVETQSKLHELLPKIEPLDSELPVLFLPASEGGSQGVRGPDLAERQGRQAKHPPVSFPNGTRPSRLRGGVKSSLYRTPQYLTEATRIGVGERSDWLRPRSGKRFRGVWLTESEHTQVMRQITNSRDKGGE